MAKVKSMADTKEKWIRKVGQAGPDYTKGVSDPSVDWEGPTKAGENNYKEGVIRAANEGRFGRGVAEAGNEKWRRKTMDVGPSRWSSGVAAAGPDYEKGMAPVLSTLAGISYPARYPAGDSRNLERVKAENEALHKLKTGK